MSYKNSHIQRQHKNQSHSFQQGFCHAGESLNQLQLKLLQSDQKLFS